MFLNRLATALFASWRPNDQHSKKGGILMPTLNKWSLGICLAIFIALLGVSPPASADTSTPGDGYTAPAPSKKDPAGTDQDQFCIPSGSFIHPLYGFGSYMVNDQPQDEGCHPTGGASSITVTTSFDSGTWTFDYPNSQPGTEAANSYSISVGTTCKTEIMGSSLYREVVASAVNGDDDADISFSIWPQVIDLKGIVTVYDSETAYDIPDGETAVMQVMENKDSILGLRPGKYRVKFWHSYAGPPWDGDVVKEMKFTVPTCDGDNPGGTSHHARGKLSRVGCRAVRVTADTRGFTAAPSVTYRVFRKAYGKIGHAKSMVVPAGQKHAYYLRNFGHRWSRVKLTAQRPDGHWAVLSRLRMFRCHR